MVTHFLFCYRLVCWWVWFVSLLFGMSFCCLDCSSLVWYVNLLFGFSVVFFVCEPVVWSGRLVFGIWVCWSVSRLFEILVYCLDCQYDVWCESLLMDHQYIVRSVTLLCGLSAFCLVLFVSFLFVCPWWFCQSIVWSVIILDSKSVSLYVLSVYGLDYHSF